MSEPEAEIFNISQDANFDAKFRDLQAQVLRLQTREPNPPENQRTRKFPTNPTRNNFQSNPRRANFRPNNRRNNSQNFSSNSQNFQKSNIICFFCGRRGHFQRECRVLQASLQASTDPRFLQKSNFQNINPNFRND